jgi:hypothetical protein
MAEQQFTTEELSNEVWKDVVGFEGVYSISNLGRLRRDLGGTGKCKGGRILKFSVSEGYLRAQLSHRGIRTYVFVHRLVAAAFIGERPAGMEVNHKDPKTGKMDNRASNLEYCTHRENIQHAARNGLMPTGDRNGSRLHPERLRRGDNSPSRLHPEKLSRGENHYSRTHPEKMAWGERNGSRKHPERLARGERNGKYTKPECTPRGVRNGRYTKPERTARGERNGRALLTEAKVREIRRLLASGEKVVTVAQTFGMGCSVISSIKHGKLWKSVE